MEHKLLCEEMVLWETPTYITKMCYSAEQGGWLGIRNRYIEWVKHYKGISKSQDRFIKKHIDKICSYKKLNFYYYPA